MSTTDPHSKILAFLVGEISRKEHRQCVSVHLLYARGHGSCDEELGSWTRAKDPDFFFFSLTDQLASAVVEIAENHARSTEAGSRRYLVRTQQHLGDRQTCSFRLPPNASGGAAGTSSIDELRDMLSKTVEHAGILTAMLDELAAYRAKERLRADAMPPAADNDLPPDGSTGLYLDRAFDAEDLEWIKLAWDAFLTRGDVGGPNRASQIMLVFQAIRRDEWATTEFLRAMNTIVLPICRRLRLKEHPHLTKLGAASE